MKQHYAILALFAVTLALSGCLTAERKSYKISMTGKQSGTCTITFHNIVSPKEEGRDISFKDFAELVTDYVEGEKIENELAGCRNVKKRLYEKDGKLNGEIVFDFDSLSTLKMFKYDENSPVMMYFGTSQETFIESNGTYGGDNMPVAFWPPQTTSMTLSTKISDPNPDAVSLTAQYRKWKK
ncbi:MAG: hypothetical protein NTX15_03290 [Candidatus Kapabacteria bacterium]|nr:hypothetical protein [Candidatus Kapabacteria bacterium]